MNRFAITLHQCIILIVLFGNVRCPGNDRLWEFVHKAQELWGITVNCLCSRDNNDNDDDDDNDSRPEPSLIIKLKELVVPLPPSYIQKKTYDDAYIIYDSDVKGKYFELAVVLENGQKGLNKVRINGDKEATSIAKLKLGDMEMDLDPSLLRRNMVRLRPPFDGRPYYSLTFKSYEQARDIYERYAMYWPEYVPPPM